MAKKPKAEDLMVEELKKLNETLEKLREVIEKKGVGAKIGD